ncbi:DNA translocase FtsK [Symbiobacterium thermophilum]
MGAVPSSPGAESGEEAPPTAGTFASGVPVGPSGILAADPGGNAAGASPELVAGAPPEVAAAALPETPASDLPQPLRLPGLTEAERAALGLAEAGSGPDPVPGSTAGSAPGPAIGSPAGPVSGPGFGPATVPAPGPAFESTAKSAQRPAFGPAPGPALGSASVSDPEPAIRPATGPAPGPAFGSTAESAQRPAFGPAPGRAPGPAFGPDTEPAPGSNAGSGPGLASGPTAGSALGPAPGPAPGLEPAPGRAPGPASGLAPGLVAGSAPGRGVGSAAGPSSEPAAEPAPGPGAESVPGPAPEPASTHAPVSTADTDPDARDRQAPAGWAEYHLPSLDLLPLPESERGLSEDEILERASLLERTLASFGVEATVIDFSFGPAVTRYELQPGPGVRVNKFTALADDIALALAATDVRVEAPIPGKSAVGIEVPNKERLAVPLREVLQSPEFLASTSKLTVALGKDNAGNPVVGDLARMPHLLIAGATGSGKSVCMNTLICSLLYKARPDEVKMLMIDPKMVELSMYNGIPHLMAPVVTDPRRAAGFLKGAVKEMESRYELFAALGVRNITQYNQLVRDNPGPDPDHPRRPLPYIVIFIDELADLMMVAPADVEDAICRLAQMARACGIHLVIATQSPRVDVITGLIKANIPSRIAFAVSSQVDSRVILDAAGAERLLGRGDMLYHPAGLPKPIRAQGAYISEASVEKLVQFVKAQGRPEYTAQEVPLENGGRRGRNGTYGPQAAQEAAAPQSAVDEALPEAARIIIEHGHASVSLLQRRLRCNYTKAVRLIDQLEEMGFIGPHQGSKPREVLATMAKWHEVFGDRAGGPRPPAE